MSSNRTSSASVDNLVFDFYASASEAILQDRRSITNPITNGNVTFANNAEFCRHSLDPWKKDLSKTLIFDLYIFDPKMNKHILMERWKFHYQRNTEMKDARQLNIISRRVLTLVRSLYCFVRMMPGFNLINISAKPPTLSFQLYEQKSTYPTSFVHEISRYDFHPVSTSKGAITVSVRFITSHSVKEILTTVNGGGSGPSGGHSRRNSRTAEENGSTAAIPIPTDHGHTHTHSANPSHEEREHGSSNGKYPNSRSAGPSSLDATDNSSYSSTGTAGSQGIPIPPGSTPPLGGNRFARSSRERDPHRRSFQLPPHAEHGGDGYYSGGGSYEIEEAVRHLNQGGAGSGQGSGRGESHSGHSSQGHTPQQAGSLDSYTNAQQHMHRLSVDSTGSGPRTGSQRTSPQHYQGQGQAQSLGTDSSNTPFPPPGGYGNKANSGSYGTGPGTSYGTTAGTSYGNSYSLQSTPPFLLGEIAGRQGDRYSGNYPDLAQGESPPYPAFSSSLTSTSPHLSGGNVTMMALIEQRARTHSHGGGGSGYGSGHNDEHRGFVFNNGIKSGRVSPTSGMDFSDLKLNITPLPSSPFVHLSRGSFSEDGSRNALVPAFTPQNPQHRSAVSVGSLGRSLAGLSPAAPGDNTLDSIRMQQSQRTRLDSADGADLALFTASGDGPSTGGGVRQLSRDRERSSTTSRTEDRDSFDLHELDEDMPFAWAEADGGLSSASLMMGPAVDSVGAQLLHGLSIHSGGQGHSNGQGAYGSVRQYDSYQYGDANRTRNDRNMSNSTYTAAGLSGELMGKINDFKNLSSTFASK